MSESESERGASEGGAGAAEAAGAEFAVKLMEIAAGASISALLPLKALMNHLIATGVVDRQALLREMESNPYPGRSWTGSTLAPRQGAGGMGSRGIVRQGGWARC